MADTKISDLTPKVSLVGTEELPAADSGSNVKITTDTIRNYAISDSFQKSTDTLDDITDGITYVKATPAQLTQIATNTSDISGKLDSVVAGTNVTVDNTDPNNPVVSATGGGGSGDVVGPASSTANAIGLFDGTTGKLIKDSAKTIVDSVAGLGGDDTTVPTSKAVADAISGAGGGDMLQAVYDPTMVESDAFDMDNMVEGTTNKILTSAERTILGNTSGTNTGDQTSIAGITGTTAQFNTALTDGDFATLAGTETLTNKTYQLDNSQLYSHPTVDHATYYATGANSPTRLYLIPKGTPASGLQSGIKLFATDYVADTVNYFDFGIYVTDTDCRFNSKEGGTFGTNLPFVWSFQDENYKVMELALETGTNKGRLKMDGIITFSGEVDNGNSSTADTIDWNSGQKQKSTLTGNCTFTFTAPDAGVGNFTLKLVQDATGSRTVTRPATVKRPGGTSPTLTTDASAVDIVSFYYDGTNYYGQAGLDFS